MKKIFTYIACALLALGAVSCAKDGMKLPESEKDGLTLRFSLGNPTTKADRLSVGNEDRVNKIDYFFYKVVDGTISTDTAPLIAKRTLTPENKLAVDYEQKLTSADLKLLYPNPDDQVAIYAVANLPGSVVLPEGKTFDTITLAELKAIEVRNTFAGTERWPHPLKVTDNDLSFVMTGELILDLTAASNVVKLERLASKVTVEFTYNNVEDPKDNRLIWIPQNEGSETRVYLSNAIATTTLGGPLDTSVRPYVTDSGDTWRDGTRDIFEYSYDYMKDLKGATPYYYTYPIKMKAGDDNQPYIKLVLPWYAYEKSSLTATTTEDGKTTYTVPDGVAPVKQKEVYYKIALPIDDLKEGNRIYQYTSDISIVGADTEVMIDATYYVFNWDSDQPISSNLATGQYLSLDLPKNTYDMYSNLLQILYVASGDVKVYVNKISQENLSSGVTELKFMENNVVTAGNQYITVNGRQRTLLQYKKISEQDIDDWVDLIIKDGRPMLQISHVMNNEMTDENGNQNTAFDMAPYVYDLTLQLTDDTEHIYDKHIVITQYPPMYVTSQLSNGYVFVNGRGYPYNNNDDDGNNIGNLPTRPESLPTTNIETNSSPYIYTITTSIVPDETYKIGDPRVREHYNLESLGLTNYYPTNPDGTENLISPKFLVASSYGAVNRYHNLEAAEKRCASYQENGYPAGRWRVPTYAEIRFLVTLSSKNFIPSLFRFGQNDYRGYWSANGKVIGNSNSLPELNTTYNDRNTAVRCVYDVWYWGEGQIDNNNQPTTTSPATTWRGFHDND